MKLLEGGLAIDDRGTLMFMNVFDIPNIKRFYVVKNHSKGFVRAWHGHKKEEKYVFVVTGSAIIGIVPMVGDEGAQRFVLSADKPQVLHIPSGYYNGFKTLTDDTKVVFFSTTTLEEAKDDDYRLPADKFDLFNIEER